jgi:predicted RNase H-like nuclease (RuvC/YqgF family)
MTDDLVKRLRNLVGQYIGDADIDDELQGAADRIEKLEAELHGCFHRIEELQAALREIADGPRDADKSYVSLFHEIQSEARKALDAE